VVSRARPLLWEKIPFFFVAAVSSVITYLAQNSQNAVKTLTKFPLEFRLANGLVSYTKYIAKMLWPKDLAVFYPHPGQSLPIWQAILAGLILLIISIAVIRLGRRYPYLPVGWLWYVGTLVPVIGLVQVGEQAMADRYTYVPLIGLFVIIAWGVPELVSGWAYRRTALAVTAAVVLSVLMLSTWKQLHHWKSSTALFEHALDVTESNSVAHFGLGNALLEEGKATEAIHHYSEALRLDPGYVAVRINWGIALLDQGRPADAGKHFSKVLEINPHDGRAHLNLGVALARQGRTAEAIDHYFKASLQDPVNASLAYYNIACEYAKQHKTEKSLTWLEKAIRKGFRNWNHIKGDKDLDSIRSSARYKELIEDH
jgi:tetratricopeptide (TPR) repeat protein